MISLKEQRKRKHKKELNSFRNKMGKNLVWFDSLTLSKQYNLLFEWKRIKHQNKIISTEVVKVKRYNHYLRKYETIEVVNYPASLKHFIKSRRKSSRYRPSTDKVRESALNILFKN